MQAPRLNMMTLVCASNMWEASERAVELPTPQGIRRPPTMASVVDPLERAKTTVQDAYQGTVMTCGTGGRALYTVVPDVKEKEVDSPRVRLRGGSDALTSEELAGYIGDNWKPGVLNIFHVRGHGHAHQDVAGMPTQTFVKGVHQAAEKVGKLDLVLLESCLMGNFEVLNSMRGAARYVIASEDALNAEALPLQRLVEELSAEEADPRRAAEAIVERTAETKKAFTFVAFDLDRLESVETSLGELQDKLKAELEAGNKKAVKKAVKSSQRFPRRGGEIGMAGGLDIRDLGEIARALAGSEALAPGTRQAAEGVLEALDQAVLKRTTTEDYKDTSGLSVRTGTVAQDMGWNLFDSIGEALKDLF